MPLFLKPDEGTEVKIKRRQRLLVPRILFCRSTNTLGKQCLKAGLLNTCSVLKLCLHRWSVVLRAFLQRNLIAQQVSQELDESQVCARSLVKILLVGLWNEGGSHKDESAV